MNGITTQPIDIIDMGGSSSTHKGGTIELGASITDKVLVYEFFDHRKAKQRGAASYSLYYVKKPSDF